MVTVLQDRRLRSVVCDSMRPRYFLIRMAEAWWFRNTIPARPRVEKVIMLRPQ